MGILNFKVKMKHFYSVDRTIKLHLFILDIYIYLIKIQIKNKGFCAIILKKSISYIDTDPIKLGECFKNIKVTSKEISNILFLVSLSKQILY